ncbi:MAG TPA: 4Fe-4S dicluster domain-containing protein, partial [Longimicrobiales bacterium]|nr:4Fe-4S dicluster domain-containing protein [Longimicrobiales bacterium]
MTTEIATKEFEQKMLACVHCGFCLTACPTYTRLGDEADSPRGRIYLMRAVQEGRLAADDPAVTTHIDRCLGCRACETVCPSGVEYGFLLERARDTIREKAGSSLMAQLLLRGFGDKRIARVASFFSRLFRATRIPHFIARTAPNSFGKTKFSMAMLAASAPSRSFARPLDRPIAPSPAIGRVALLTGCVQEGLYSRVNRATEYVIRENGFDVVDVPAQQCCGALHAHSGELDQSRERARVNIAAFEKANVDYIIV